MYDWKKPLYQSACMAQESMDLSSFERIAEYFRLLGDYEDSRQRNKDCLNFPSAYFDTLLKQVRSARSTAELDKAAKELDRIRRIVGHEAFLQSPWKEQNEKFQSLFSRREWIVFCFEHPKVVTIAGWFAFILIVCSFVRIHDTLQPRMLASRASRAYENGDYQKAVSLYEESAKAQTDFYKKGDYKEELNEARIRAGTQAMDTGDFKTALNYFKDAEEESLIQKASLAFARDLIKKEEYASAASHLESAGSSEEAENTRLSLVSMLTDKAEYSLAIQVVRQLKDQEAADSRLKELYQKRADHLIQAAQNLEEPDPEAVRSLGIQIDDVDSLLRFTRTAVENGYNPYKIFSGGVPVQDLVVDADFSAASPDAQPDLSRVLAAYQIRMPENIYPGDLLSSVYSLKEKNGEASETEKTLLFPAISYSIDSRFRAQSLSECTAILLLRSYYQPSGKVKGTMKSGNFAVNSGSDIVADYVTLERHDEIYLCSRTDPACLCLIDQKISQAQALLDSQKSDGTTPVYQYSSGDILKNADPLIGQPDGAWITSVLDKAIDQINGREE